jgi:PAS domain S-box-containing protein
MKNDRFTRPWLIMVAAFLLVVVFFILGYQSFKAAENVAFTEFNERQLVLAREAAGGIELYFDSLAGDLRSLGERPEVRSLEELIVRREIQYIFDKWEPLGANDIGVLDANGTLRYNVMAPQIEDQDFSWRTYYQEAKEMAPGDTYIIEFIAFQGVELGERGVLVAVPMYEADADSASTGGFTGVIVATLKLDTITERFVAPIKSSERGHAFLIDDEHNVLWSADSSLFGKNMIEEAMGFPAFQQILRLMSAGTSGSGMYSYFELRDPIVDAPGDSRSGDEVVDKLIAYAPIALGKESWSIGVLAPQEDARQLVRSSYLRQQLIVGLSILVTLVGAAYAISRLKESYGRVAQEQGKVLAAIEASRDPIWVSDADRKLVMVNSALEEIIDQPRQELLGRTCRNMLNMRTRDGTLVCDTACPIVYSSGENGTVEACLMPEGSDEIWSEISYGRVLDANGRLSGAVHIAHDLTERKEVERLKDEFISTVSHELRTPLNHIKGYATTLLQTDVEWDKATEQDFLESISGEADRLTNLVEKILHLSRLEADGLPMDKEWYQVNDLVNGALQRRRGLVRDREVDMHLATSLPALFVDGREIEVVLMNLIENAAKYSDPSALITLGTELEGDQVVFSISDQGAGIPPDEEDKIFERFYRAEGVGHGSAGTGLGLAICKRIIEAHNGRIWVESSSGTGSCFCFSLPMDGTTNEAT